MFQHAAVVNCFTQLPEHKCTGRGQETKTSAPILYLTPANHLYQIMQSVRVTGPARQIVTPFFIQ